LIDIHVRDVRVSVSFRCVSRSMIAMHTHRSVGLLNTCKKVITIADVHLIFTFYLSSWSKGWQRGRSDWIFGVIGHCKYL